jgi:uncharacterized protein (TIGR03435 family)
MKYLAAIATLIFTAYAAAPADKFEVAAIHPTDPASYRGASMKFLPGGGLSVSGMTIGNLISLAWQFPSERVTGGPKWLDSDLYDIQAKPPAGSASSMDSARPRIQALLADRFQLKVHRATKNSPIYLLTIAKSGLKMEEAKGPDARYNDDKGSLLPWSAFVPDLSRRLGRPVVDKTGLKGVWYIKLRYTTDDGKPSGMGIGRIDPTQPGFEAGPSIFTAVQEQLGLKLDAGTGPVDTLVIDSIARPSVN